MIQKKHSVHSRDVFFLAPLKRKGTNPRGRVSEARDSFNFFCPAEKNSRDFFKATP